MRMGDQNREEKLSVFTSGAHLRSVLGLKEKEISGEKCTVTWGLFGYIMCMYSRLMGRYKVKYCQDGEGRARDDGRRPGKQGEDARRSFQAGNWIIHC